MADAARATDLGPPRSIQEETTVSIDCQLGKVT
jgi:hypothetical protein